MVDLTALYKNMNVTIIRVPTVTGKLEKSGKTKNGFPDLEKSWKNIICPNVREMSGNFTFLKENKNICTKILLSSLQITFQNKADRSKSDVNKRK